MNTKTKIYAALALSGALSVLSSAKADILATYDFTGANGLQASTVANFDATNVTAGAITRGANYGAPASSSAFTSNGIAFSPGLITANSVFLANYTEATAIANNAYFEFSMSVDTGFEFDVSSITFGARRAGSSSGPNNLSIRSSLNSFATTLDSQAITGTAADPTEVIFDLGTSAQSISGTVIFRVYGYGRGTSASYGLVTISSDSFSPFTINGAVSAIAIPEPSSFALGLGVAVVGVVALRRRRR